MATDAAPGPGPGSNGNGSGSGGSNRHGGAGASAGGAAGGDPSHRIKRIDFFGRGVSIVMQNNNGPCPLLAIANVLSLRNELKLPRGRRDITQHELISLIVDLLLERGRHFTGQPHAADFAQNVADVFPVLQKLTTGIDVNVKFHHPHAFEPTPEVAVFDLLGIPLAHGWLVDPERDAEAAEVFGNRSYNELVEALLAGLDDGQVERLASGPLRALSLTAHSHTSQQLQQLRALSGDTAAAPPWQQHQHQQHQQHQQQQGPSLLDGLPQLPRVATKSLSGGAAAAAAEAVAPPPAEGRAADDALIEELVEEVLAEVCCETQPGRIELGDSPTHCVHVNRRLAYEGAGPSRLGSSSSGGGGAAAAAPAAAVGAGAAAGAAQAVHSGGEAALADPTAASGVGGGPGTPKQAARERQRQQPPGASAAKAGEAQVIQRFMEENCSQLTPFGLAAVTDSLKEHHLAVFFRNNHFNCLFKYEGGAYLLVTDQGYECEPDIVWERLDSVNGDTTFCTSAFTPFVPHRDAGAGEATYAQAAAAAGGGGGGQLAATDLDAAIAASLASMEEEAAGGGGGGDGPAAQHQQRHAGTAGGGGGGGGGGADDLEDADFALALQLQLQEEEEAARLQAQRQQQRQQQQQQAAQQQQGQEQQQQQQQQPSLAASVRSMSRRIAGSVDRAASNLQQQRAAYVQQQQAAFEAAQQERQRQQHHHQQPQAALVPNHQRQYMEQQSRRHKRSAGGARQQQEDKCSIM